MEVWETINLLHNLNHSTVMPIWMKKYLHRSSKSEFAGKLGLNPILSKNSCKAIIAYYIIWSSIFTTDLEQNSNYGRIWWLSFMI